MRVLCGCCYISVLTVFFDLFPSVIVQNCAILIRYYEMLKSMKCTIGYQIGYVSTQDGNLMKNNGLSNYYRRRLTDPRSSPGDAIKDTAKMIAKTVAGGGLAALSYSTGPVTYLHEWAHETAARLLYKDPYTSIQVDGIDNFNSFCEKPGWQTFLDWLKGVDANEDGAAGCCWWSGSELSGFGEMLGPKKSKALLCAAGTMTEELLALGLLFSGHKRRKMGKDPVFRLSASAACHISPTVYSWSAYFPESELGKHPGNDWVNFAEVTGIPPLYTALAITLWYPALATTLYLKARHDRKKREKKSYLDTLVRIGKVKESQLDAALDSYSRKRKLLKAEADAVDTLAPGDEKKRFGKLLKEYSKSTDYFGKTFNKEIEKIDKWWDAEGKEVEEQGVYDISKTFGIWDRRKSRKMYKRLCIKLFSQYESEPLEAAKWFCKKFKVVPRDENYSDVISVLKEVHEGEDIYASFKDLNAGRHKAGEHYVVSPSDVNRLKGVIKIAEWKKDYCRVYQEVKSLDRQHKGNYGAAAFELAVYGESSVAEVVL